MFVLPIGENIAASPEYDSERAWSKENQQSIFPTAFPPAGFVIRSLCFPAGSWCRRERMRSWQKTGTGNITGFGAHRRSIIRRMTGTRWSDICP